MKVSSFEDLIEGENINLVGKSGKLRSDRWELKPHI